jgi:hypothetical protein
LLRIPESLNRHADIVTGVSGKPTRTLHFQGRNEEALRRRSADGRSRWSAVGTAQSLLATCIFMTPNKTTFMEETLRRRVLEVYAEVDAAIAAAQPRCDASGRCCRFAEWGHTLFLSRFEAEILLETAPEFTQPVGASHCPFQVGNLCTARAERPLGCRIYFCDPAFQHPQQAITERALAQLKRIADEYGTGWHYAPLHHFLNRAEPMTDQRKTLPLCAPTQ